VVRAQIATGADSIEHATGMDDATIAEMARRKTFYVPTIDHNRYYADNYRKLNYPVRSMDELNAFVQRNLETAHKAFTPACASPWVRTRSTPCSAKIRANWVGLSGPV
jgi:hypothetical protein